MYTIDAANEPAISSSLIDSLDDKTIENIAEVVIRIWLESWQLSHNRPLSLSGLYGEEDDEGDDLLSDEFFDDDDSY